jgi:hypothetical protein
LSSWSSEGVVAVDEMVDVMEGLRYETDADEEK